jgi:hypothetical protein
MWLAGSSLATRYLPQARREECGTRAERRNQRGLFPRAKKAPLGRVGFFVARRGLNDFDRALLMIANGPCDNEHGFLLI